MWKLSSAIVLSLLSTIGIVLGQQLSHFHLGLVALEHDRLHEALKQLTFAEREQASNARVHNFRGIVLMRMGKPDEAAVEYRQAIRLDPRLAAAYRNLGFLEWNRNRLAQARQAFLSALSLDPRDSHTLFDLGQVELQQGRYEEAFLHFNESGLPWPDDPNSLLRIAAGEVSLHRDNSALKTVVKLTSMPLTPAQSVSLGSLMITLREYTQALALFERLDQENGKASWAEFDLALAEQMSGYAREAARRALALASHHADWEPWSLEGIAEAHLGKHGRSIKAFRHAAKLDPHHEERWLDLTRELMEVQQYEEAAEAAKEGLQFNPRSYALRLRLGAAYLNGGRYPQAEQVFRDLVAHNDPFPTSTIGLAQVLLRTGRAQQAVEVLSQTQNRIGDDFLLAYFRGIALERAGEPQQAIAAFRGALRFNPLNPEARRWLGEVELQTQHAPAAIEQLTESLKLNPSDSQARLLLSRAYWMTHNPETAALIAREVKPSALPETGADESKDFPYPAWQIPPGCQ